jgi:hypothetical protein
MSSHTEQAITDKLQEFLNQIMTSENVTQIENVQEASGWHKSIKDKDEFLSNVANSVITRLMDHASIPFVNLIIDEIRLNTSESEPNVKFNVSFETDPIKPYIEFVKVVNGVPTITLVKTVFQIVCNGSLIDTEIQFKDNSKILNLNELKLNFEISIIKIGVMGIQHEQSRILGTKEYTLDLSSHSLQI